MLLLPPASRPNGVNSIVHACNQDPIPSGWSSVDRVPECIEFAVPRFSSASVSQKRSCRLLSALVHALLRSTCYIHPLQRLSPLHLHGMLDSMLCTASSSILRTCRSSCRPPAVHLTHIIFKNHLQKRHLRDGSPGRPTPARCAKPFLTPLRPVSTCGRLNNNLDKLIGPVAEKNQTYSSKTWRKAGTPTTLPQSRRHFRR